MDPNEYRRLADFEDTHWHFDTLHSHIRRALSGRLPAADVRVLDAGCGTGGLMRRLQRWLPEAQITGVDFSPLAVECARERAPGSEVREGSVTALPFAEDSFDAIVSTDVLCQIERPSEAYKEFARCLRPGGVIVVNVPAYRWMWSYHDAVTAGIHRFTRPEIRRMAEGVGLATVSSTYWNALPFPLIALRRKLLPPPAEGSDVREYPGWITWPMRGAMALEGAWLSTGLSLPFGCSVFVVSVKSLERAEAGAV